MPAQDSAHLIVHGHLCVLEMPDASVEVVDEQTAEFATDFRHLSCLTIPVPATCAQPLTQDLQSANRDIHGQTDASGAHEVKSPSTCLIIRPGVPAHSCSSSPALMTTGSILRAPADRRVNSRGARCTAAQRHMAYFEEHPQVEAHFNFLKASSVWKVFPQPFGPQIPNISGGFTPSSWSAMKFLTTCICAAKPDSSLVVMTVCCSAGACRAKPRKPKVLRTLPGIRSVHAEQAHEHTTQHATPVHTVHTQVGVLAPQRSPGNAARCSSRLGCCRTSGIPTVAGCRPQCLTYARGSPR